MGIDLRLNEYEFFLWLLTSWAYARWPEWRHSAHMSTKNCSNRNALAHLSMDGTSWTRWLMRLQHRRLGRICVSCKKTMDMHRKWRAVNGVGNFCEWSGDLVQMIIRQLGLPKLLDNPSQLDLLCTNQVTNLGSLGCLWPRTEVSKLAPPPGRLLQKPCQTVGKGQRRAEGENNALGGGSTMDPGCRHQLELFSIAGFER
jgi:hypothetical protein